MNSGMSEVSRFESSGIDTSVSKAKQLKQIALTKAEESKWKESQDLLLKICEFERALQSCDKKNFSLDLADFLHHLGVAQSQLGNIEAALKSFHESLMLHQQLKSDAFNAVPTILTIAKLNLNGETEGTEDEVYKLLTSQLAQHRISKSCKEIICHVLRQFECAFEALNPNTVDPM